MPRLTTLRDLGASRAGGDLPWPQARIITHGFVAGGYKDSSPWRNVNRTNHSTDITTNLGDKMSEAASYSDGANSDLYFYVYAIANAFMGSSATTWSMNMTNEASRGGATASWNMTVSRNDLGTMVDYEHAGAKVYIVGGGNAATDRFDLKTETMATSAQRPQNSATSNDFTATSEGRFRGWHKTGSTAQSFTWSTETYASWTTSPGSDGWGKALSSYKGYSYMKNGGNLNATLVKYNDDTGAQISSFGVQNAGEENYQSGANKGYCLGHYNGAQNNNTYKVSYVNDVANDLSSTPGGNAGMSSASLASAYSITNATYGTTAPNY